MIIKVIEIRDRNTCIAAMAIKMLAAGPVEHVYLWRCGYPSDGSGVILMRLDDQRATSDPYDWSDSRTMRTAHLDILDRFDDLSNGDVVDVRVYLKEAETPVEPEIYLYSTGKEEKADGT